MPEPAAFSASYAEARGRFVDASRALGARVYEYRDPRQKGPDGEPLCLDVAVAGPEDAERVLVVASGTHGIEGFAGSAAQTSWLLAGGPSRLPRRTAVALFHALNPWGFAHRARGTEENVDLNRNFLDHAKPYPANPGYAEVHPLVTPDAWDDASQAAVFRSLDALRERIGEKAFSTAFNGGQFSHDDGLYFGGHREQWANYAFREAVVKHVAHAKHAAIIDLHTGIGPWGEHIFLCFHAEGSTARKRARDWWGERAVNLAGVTHKALADYEGLGWWSSARCRARRSSAPTWRRAGCATTETAIPRSRAACTSSSARPSILPIRRGAPRSWSNPRTSSRAACRASAASPPSDARSGSRSGSRPA